MSEASEAVEHQVRLTEREAQLNLRAALTLCAAGEHAHLLSPTVRRPVDRVLPR